MLISSIPAPKASELRNLFQLSFRAENKSPTHKAGHSEEVISAMNTQAKAVFTFYLFSYDFCYMG